AAAGAGGARAAREMEAPRRSRHGAPAALGRIAGAGRCRRHSRADGPLGVLLALWIPGSSVVQLRERLKSGRPPRAFWGMHLAHIGVAVVVVGITLVKGYEVEKDVKMAPSDTLAIGSYPLKLIGIRPVTGPNYTAQRGEIELSQDGRVLRVLQPEKRSY